MVGAAGLEPTTTGTPYRCATKLRHAPTEKAFYVIIAPTQSLSTKMSYPAFCPTSPAALPLPAHGVPKLPSRTKIQRP